MAAITHNITISISGAARFDPMIAAQFDTNSHILKIQLLKDFMAYTPLSGDVFYFRATKPDGKMILAQVECSSEGVITYTLTAQATTTVGYVNCEIAIVNGSEQILSQPFLIKVRKAASNDNAIASSNEMTVLNEALEKVTEAQEAMTHKVDDVTINSYGNLRVIKSGEETNTIIPGRFSGMAFTHNENKLTIWKTVEPGGANYMTTIISAVKTSNEEGNALVRKSDGMYVPKAQVVADPQTKKMTDSSDVFWDYIYSDSQGLFGESTVEFIGPQIGLSKKHLGDGDLGYYAATYSIPDDYYQTYKYFAVKFSGAEGDGTCAAITHDQAISDNILSENGSKMPTFGSIGSTGVQVVVLPLEAIRSANSGLIGTHIHFGGLYTGNNTPYITVEDMMWTNSDDDLASF